jgi:hypothetical protein
VSVRHAHAQILPRIFAHTFLAQGPAAWWRSKLTTWPLLAPVALWHLGFPASSIAIERVFARMRMMGTPQRLSADNATFARELRLRANEPLLEAMVAETNRKVRLLYL